jgi:hypothetical protein
MPQTDPIPAANLRCHHTGFKVSCRKLVVGGKCQKWVAVKGKGPQDAEEMNYHGCVDSWLPTLFMDFAKMTNRVAGEVGELRKENVARQDATLMVLGQIRDTPPVFVGPRGETLTSDPGHGTPMLPHRS